MSQLCANSRAAGARGRRRDGVGNEMLNSSAFGSPPPVDALDRGARASAARRRRAVAARSRSASIATRWPTGSASGGCIACTWASSRSPTRAHAPGTRHGRGAGLRATARCSATAGPRATGGCSTARRARPEVTCPRRRRRPGITAHRADAARRRRRRSMTASRSRAWRAPCSTSPTSRRRRLVERALHQAEVLRLFDLRALEDVLARANGRRGAAVLRAALAAEPRVHAQRARGAVPRAGPGRRPPAPADEHVRRGLRGRRLLARSTSSPSSSTAAATTTRRATSSPTASATSPSSKPVFAPSASPTSA